MKILIVSYYFPPFNAVGAVRIGKLAKYLVQSGHEIKVLTANNQPWMPSLPVEVEEKHIIRTRWFDVNKPIQFLLGGKKSIAAKGFERAGRMPNIIKKMGYFYKDIINFPDGQIGWYPFAVRAGKKILNQWNPDFIFSSSSPVTSFLIARKLSRLYDVPWIADFRDLWTDNHNIELYQSATRRMIDKKIEKWTLSTAKALITVSDPLAEILRKKYAKPVGIITNGYDLEDYPVPDNIEHEKFILKIVHAGLIHLKRDPEPLFKAISLLNKEGVCNVKVDFYGRNNGIIDKSAVLHGISNIVSCYDTVSYQESLKLQVNADILLLLTYNSEQEYGVITTKFFEYLGARRPILLIGCINGIAANIIKENNLGCASNDPSEIAEFLKKHIFYKENEKSNQLPLNEIPKFSRQKQAFELVSFLEKINLS